MPYVFVENDPVINNYHGITIYHLYRNDQVDAGRRVYWYTTDPVGTDYGEGSFDVREKAGYDPKMPIAMNLVKMIDSGIFGAVKSEEVDKRCVADGAEKACCPICGRLLTPNDFKENIATEENQLVIPFICPNCGVTGKKLFSVVFSGEEID